LWKAERNSKSEKAKRLYPTIKGRQEGTYLLFFWIWTAIAPVASLSRGITPPSFVFA
jgi:hypothetical protein